MQSLINRRATLAGAASLPAMSISAVADPIYATIEEHRRLFAVRGATLESNDDWDSPKAMAASEAEWQAADRLLNTRPVTVAGVAALLRYLYEFEREHPDTFWCGPDGSWGEAEDGRVWAFMLHCRAAEALEALS
jgi:RES domain-containing protein